jgi:hypothetical protein
MCNYYEALRTGGPLYVAVVLYQDRPTIYIERGSKPNRPDICRCFYKRRDALDYLMAVAEQTGISNGDLRCYEVMLPETMKIIAKLQKSMQDSGRDRLRLISTTIIDNKFTDLEIFWSNQHKDVV